MGYPTTSLDFEQQHVSMRTPQPEKPKFSGFEELLYLREAASLLGMHWKTLEIMARGRKIPALKVGKRWRFRASALNLWLEHGINSNATNHAALTGQE
jgi:excisionase family DNA binding protein